MSARRRASRRQVVRRVMVIGLLLVTIAVPASKTPSLVRDASAQVVQKNRSGTELRIDADQGIEWRRQEKVVIARGNAQAVRGDLKVQARELRALYREGLDGNNEIFRVIATGGVRLFAPNQTATGERAVYEVDEDRLLLTGGDRVRLVSDDSEVSAEKSLEYWPKVERLVATGDAVAVQPNRQIFGDIITVYFADEPAGQRGLATAEAVGNVKVVTADETIYSDTGNYDAKSGIATVEGSVKIVRGTDRLDGCRGQMDFNTGVSRLFACERLTPGDGRVRGRIQIDRDGGG